MFGILDLDVEGAVKNLNDWDHLVVDDFEHDIAEVMADKKREVTNKVLEIILFKERTLKQKFRQRCVYERITRS